MSVVLISREAAEPSLTHWRTKGSKNGIRRYQNPDGSLTPEGRIHYGVGEPRKKSLTDDNGDLNEAGVRRIEDSSKRGYLNPLNDERKQGLTKNRDKIVNAYDKDYWNAVKKGMDENSPSETGRNLWDKYKDDYARATLKDFGVNDTDKNVERVKKIFSDYDAAYDYDSVKENVEKRWEDRFVVQPEKDRAIRQKKIEKVADKIDRINERVAQQELRAEKLQQKAEAASAKESSYLDRANRKANIVSALKAPIPFKHAEVKRETMLNSKSYARSIQQRQKALKLSTKSAAYNRKAERGKAKLERYRKQLMDLLPEEFEHSFEPKDFFAVLDELSEKQRQAVYALMDDILPDEDIEHADDYLMHFRTKGSKNGVRRYQYKDGSLTPLGYIHYGIGKGRNKSPEIDSGEKKEPKDSEIEKNISSRIKEFNEANKAKREARAAAQEEEKKKREEERKSVREMDDKELNDRIDRLQREKRYSELLNERANREKGPLAAKASKLFQEAAENLARRSLNLAVDKVIDKAKEKLDKNDQFKLGDFKNIDVYSLDSEKLAAVSNAFNQAASIVRNKYAVENNGRSPNDNNNNNNNGNNGGNQQKQDNKPKNDQNEKPKEEPKKQEKKPIFNTKKNEVNQSNNSHPTVSKNMKKKMRAMASSGKNSEEIAKILGVSGATVREYAGDILQLKIEMPKKKKEDE